jgi:hypothetical protein
MKRIATAVAAALVLAAPAACFDPPPDDVDVEVEDCDAEDRRNREAECGFLPDPGVRSNSDAHRDRPVKPATKPKANTGTKPRR